MKNPESEKMWVCVTEFVNKDNSLRTYPDKLSLRYKRSESIASFIDGSRKNWKWYYRRGWRCVRVQVNLTII